MKIPLFDVDWTLIEGGNKAHDEAHDYAMQTVYGVPTASKKELTSSGMIDTQIIVEVLKLHGLSEKEIKAKMTEAINVMNTYYELHKDEGVCIVLPGVKELLRTLQNKQIPCGVLTGNVEQIGWEKIQRAGLKEFFQFGAFGDAAYIRADLVPIARKRAEKVLEREIALTDFVIVGDAPLDVACAKANDIQVISVTSGHHSAKELKGIGSDLVLSSLKQQYSFLQFILQ